MSSKIITKESFPSEQDYEKALGLIKEIKRRHTLIATETEKFTEDKKTLCETHGDLFLKDVSKELPELTTNHDYHLDEGIVSVNFRVIAKPMENLKVGAVEKPAAEVLKELFLDNYETLFREEDSYKITAEQGTLNKLSEESPECFRISLKQGLSNEDLKKAVEVFPEVFEITVMDEKAFAVKYPSHVEKTVKVKTNEGFIDTVSGFGDSLKKRVRKFLIGFLKSYATPQVVCGKSGKDSKSKK